MARRNGYWQRHPIKELQALLVVLHEAGWRIQNPPKYFKVFCTCGSDHKSTIHLTPSDPYYRGHKCRFHDTYTCFVCKERR